MNTQKPTIEDFFALLHSENKRLGLDVAPDDKGEDYWQRRHRDCREALLTVSAQRDELLAAAHLAQAVIGGSDTSGSGQRQAHTALLLAISNAETP